MLEAEKPPNPGGFFFFWAAQARPQVFYFAVESVFTKR